jgi:3',5'-cyclic AMP phosphodiesterase CpdA
MKKTLREHIAAARQTLVAGVRPAILLWKGDLAFRRYSILIIVSLVAAAAVFLAARAPFAGWKPWSGSVDPETSQPIETTLLKIGFSNDWEYGTRKRLKHKLTNQAPAELRKVVRYFNEIFRPDIVIGGGDYIESSGVKPATALEQLRLINGIFSEVQAPRLYALGNHDMRVLSKEDVRSVLGMDANHTVRDIGDFRLIVLDTNFTKENLDRTAESYVTGHVSPEELAWLRQALVTERPVIVFVHHSPIPVPFGNGAYVINIDNAAEVRATLEKEGNVVAVISGHNPMAYYEEHNGIHYFVVDTLVNETGLGSFATIEVRHAPGLRYAELRFRQFGRHAVRYVVDWEWGESRRERDPLLEESLWSAVEDVTDEGALPADIDVLEGE